MIDIGSLTEQERIILFTIGQMEGRIDEHVLHMMMSIGENMMNMKGEQGKLFDDFTIESFYHKFGNGYETGCGSQQYSPKLHETVEGLVKKSILRRGAQKPLVLYVNEQKFGDLN